MNPKWIKLLLAVACGVAVMRYGDSPMGEFIASELKMVGPVAVAVIVWCMASLLRPESRLADRVK